MSGGSPFPQKGVGAFLKDGERSIYVEFVVKPKSVDMRVSGKLTVPGEVGGVFSRADALVASGNRSKKLSGCRARAKRALKVFRVKSSKKLLVLGKDIKIDRVESLSLRALVGRLGYVSMNTMEVLRWINEVWKPLLWYCPKFSLLMNGWM